MNVFNNTTDAVSINVRTDRFITHIK